MNIRKEDILKVLIKEPYINQRTLANTSNYSLGAVNRSIKELIDGGYLDSEIRPTDKAMSYLEKNSPKNAVILAAGYGMRMVPINTETSKGLLEVNGEVLIERIIRHLQEAGIKEIYVVVGFMKEHYEYLIDEFGVELIVNTTYSSKNNLHSMKCVLEHLSNTYVVPCDIWCEYNPFSNYELYSWYMVSDLVDNESTVRVNRKREFVSISDSIGGNAMIGISYLMGREASIVRDKIQKLSQNPQYDNAFWEEALYENGKMIVAANVVHSSEITEINTYEQLRELDGHSQKLKSDAITAISKVLNVKSSEIMDITVLKKGMTNRSFLFQCKNQKYIMRIPGEGTEKLINRTQEADVYSAIKGKEICDDLIYIDPERGYKITRYLETARVCDPTNLDDIHTCMKKLRNFHEMELVVNHEFDIFSQIDFYESLWTEASVYKDYAQTKEKVNLLKNYIEENIEKKVLTHIDAVPDNFLFVKNADGEESLQLIDWEYAGMQDPHLDIAMFCIYALYDKKQVDQLIDAYFPEGCTERIRYKIYSYISVCGLLWSNWCEYKRSLGVEFGEYSLRQYRYAKDYFKIVNDKLKMK